MIDHDLCEDGQDFFLKGKMLKQAKWGDTEQERLDPDPGTSNPNQKRNWVEVLVGNRDTTNGWTLHYSPLM